MLDKVLVCVPHRDDECLGLGGTLFQCRQIELFYFNRTHPLVPQKVYDEEAHAVRHTLGCESFYSNQWQLITWKTFPSPITSQKLKTRLTPLSQTRYLCLFPTRMKIIAESSRQQLRLLVPTTRISISRTS